ncbi:hypothetical protein [Streptomyces lavendulae]|uniref:hypothetical protein n=1 Tax=Streptomyces lavendulae TaxID=1914 RepID=UPI0037FF24E2
MASSQGSYALDADAVVCATPGTTAARILTALDAEAKKALAKVRHASAVVL